MRYLCSSVFICVHLWLILFFTVCYSQIGNGYSHRKLPGKQAVLRPLDRLAVPVFVVGRDGCGKTRGSGAMRYLSSSVFICG